MSKPIDKEENSIDKVMAKMWESLTGLPYTPEVQLAIDREIVESFKKHTSKNPMNKGTKCQSPTTDIE